MPPRRTHKKSRAGCLTCKHRRVKCDEIHPICTHCSKRKTPCNWGPDDHGSIMSSIPSRSSLSPSRLSPDSFAFDKNTLELLHHFSTSTCHTYTNRPGTLEVFRISTPRLALSHDFLMHGILAQAALHLAFLRTNVGSDPSRYIILASHHHDSAITNFLQAQPGGTLSASTRYLCSTLLNLFAIATSPPSVEPSIFYWIDNLRIQFQQMRTEWDELLLSEMGPLLTLENDAERVVINANPSIYGQFPEYLVQLCLVSGGAPDCEEVEDENVRCEYQRSIEVLHRSWQTTLSQGYHTTALHIWPCVMSDGFRSLLLSKRPRALVILAHYCALLIYSDYWKRCWWHHGRGYDDLNKIIALLDDRWLKWVEWPLHMATAMPATTPTSTPKTLTTLLIAS